MRKLVFICLAFVAVFIYSCDKIDNPFIDKGTTIGVPVVKPTHIDSTTYTSDTTLKLLVEDYTGHHCPNCPAQSTKCDQFYNANSSHVVFMEVNCKGLGGPYAFKTWSPSAPVDSAYMCNYLSTACTANWDPQFIVSGNGLPATMVNRLYYDTYGGAGADLFLHGIQVSAPGDSLIAKNNHLATIHIADSMYAPPTSTVSMSITAKLVNPVVGNKYYLVVGLTEDSIIDWQDSMNVDLPHYLRRFTFRGTINGANGAGDSLMANTSAQTQHFVYANTANFIYNSAVITNPTNLQGNQWNMAHMYVVAFIYQVTSGANNYMVLQAQSLHL